MNVLLYVEFLGTIFLEVIPLLFCYIERTKVFGILCPQYSFPIKELLIVESFFFLGGFYYQK